MNHGYIAVLKTVKVELNSFEETVEISCHSFIREKYVVQFYVRQDLNAQSCGT